MTGRPGLKELAERVAALEAVVGGTTAVGSLDARLAAVEHSVRRLRYGDEDLGEIDDTVRRCRELVSEHVPVDERIAIVSEGNPALLAPDDRPVAEFPQDSQTGRPSSTFDHDAAAIAHLEAQRVEGIRFLLLPEPARRWMQRYPEFAEHLTDRYDIVADEPGVGLLVDVGIRRVAAHKQRTLAEVLDRLLGGNRYAPVLDWTHLDLGALIVDRNVFTARAEDDRALPYIDSTIDVVIVENPARLKESRRVASGAVVVVSPGDNGGVVVTEIEEMGGEDVSAANPVLLVIPIQDPRDPWLTRVEEAVAAQPQITVVASRDPWATAAEANDDIVVVVEPGVLPLPGCIEATSALLMSDERIGGVAAKLLVADGSLAAAGSIVFADGSIEGIAAGCSEIAAPWHEYVRPVCAAAGLLAVRASALRAASIASESFVAVSAALWQAGYELRYQPDAWAVRALGAPRADGTAEEIAAEAWAPALATRPNRPVPLDVRAWRGLLAREEVTAGWR